MKKHMMGQLDEYLSICTPLDQSVGFQAESFAKSLQTTVRDTTNNLSETLSNTMIKFYEDYLKLIFDQDAVLLQGVTVLRALVDILSKAVTGIADTSESLLVSDLPRPARDSSTNSDSDQRLLGHSGSKV